MARAYININAAAPRVRPQVPFMVEELRGTTVDNGLYVGLLAAR
jgi:hypothetical protein